MATLKNRQNLTPEEVFHAIDFYNSAGHVDTQRSEVANNEIFHARNVVLVPISGSLVKDSAATLAKIKATKDRILSENK